MRVTRRMYAVLAVLAIGLLPPSMSARAAKTQIEYWQYTFKSRVDAMNALIQQFEAANPDIEVKQVTVPYANFRTRVAAAVTAGEGPDVVQLYYGWLDDNLNAHLLQKLPTDTFNPEQIDQDFFPFVQLMKRDGAYYALPTAVRALALFWNKTIFQQAGLDPNKPPQTLQELVTDAERTTKRDSAGNLLVEGFALDPSAQDHQWIREVLIRQFGGAPYSPDGKQVTYDSPAGIAAVTWYTDLITKDHVGEIGFLSDQATAFKAQKAAMTIDGSFRLSDLDAVHGLDYGVTQLPTYDARGGNFASYWVNGITSKAKGPTFAAAVKFLAFLTTPDAMKLWLEKVGELPARKAVAQTPAIEDNPKYGPFVRGLADATTTHFVDETQQRTIFINMIDRIVLRHESVAQSVGEAAAQDQKVLNGKD